MSNAKRVAWAAAALLGLHFTAVLPTASAATAPTPILPGKLPLAGNAEAGAQKAVVCSACHGQNGNSVKTAISSTVSSKGRGRVPVRSMSMKATSWPRKA